ncbi:MAG: hypothetical protein ACRDI1_08045 [Actinomycetota bacterium]
MSERATSTARPKSIEEAPVRETIIEETTTTHIYWDVGCEFEFCKYTEDDSRLSHTLIRTRDASGEAVALIESWAPRTVLEPDQLHGLPERAIKEFLGHRSKQAWVYQAVRCAPLEASDARTLERGAGEPAVCIWRYYHDHDDDLLLAQRYVLAGGYAGYFRMPFPGGHGEIKAREEIPGSSAA